MTEALPAGQASSQAANDALFALCVRLVEAGRGATGLHDDVRELDGWARGVGPEFAGAFLAEPRVRAILGRLHTVRAEVDAVRERRISRELANAADPAAALADWVRSSYPRTTIHSHRFKALIASRGVRRVLVVGAGALPETAALLVQETAVTVTCLDRDREAAAAARVLVTRAGVPRIEGVCHGDGESVPDLGGYDAVFVNLQVGVGRADRSGARARVLEALMSGMGREATLFLRSAVGLGRLSFPWVTPGELRARHLETIEPLEAGRSALMAFCRSA